MKPTESTNVGHTQVLLPLLLSLGAFLAICLPAKDLPILGDGALHAHIVREITEKGSVDIQTEVAYPLFYHLFGAQVYLLWGEVGLRVLSAGMVAFAGLLAYLIARELTRSQFIGVICILLIGLSSKVIFYGVQVLMEPFMVAFILLAVYAALLLYRQRNLKCLVFAAFAVAMAISTKQQALFLLLAIPAFLLASGLGVRRVAVLVGVVLLFASGPYAYVLSSTGVVSGRGPSAGSIYQPFPDSEDIRVAEQGGTLEQVLARSSREDIPEWALQLEEESNGLELYRRGTAPHEARHIYIWEMINPVKFVELNSLQQFESAPLGLSGAPRALFLGGYVVLQGLLICGFLISLMYAVRRKRWRIVPIVVFTSWLFTFWGSDTERYFIYLPFLLAFTYGLVLKLLADRLRPRRSRAALAALALLALLLMSYMAPAAVDTERSAQRLEMTQCYAPSVGGIASIEEVASWIEQHTDKGDRVFGTSIYEWTFYSNREVLWDYRVYFLSQERVDHYLHLWGVEYVLVRSNQIVPDEEWNHIEMYPASFCEKIADAYPLVYTSVQEDIEVYQVTDV